MTAQQTDSGPDFGLNEDGDGRHVGLWFNPERVTVDVHAYVRISLDELRTLAASIPDECQWCHVLLSPTFGLRCCDDCADRLAREREAEDEDKDRASRG